MPGFVDSHGPVDISLRGEDDPVPFDRDLIDIRLCYGRSHYSEHLTEELVRDAVYPVCSPAFLARHGPITSSASLHAVPLIHTDWGPSAASFPSWRNWFESAGVTPGRHIQHGMTANSSMAALDLARGGLGVALAQGLFCARQVEDGKLVVADLSAGRILAQLPDGADEHSYNVSPDGRYLALMVGDEAHVLETATLKPAVSYTHLTLPTILRV